MSTPVFLSVSRSRSPNRSPPTHPSNRTLIPHATAVQFQLWAKTLASGSRPRLHPPNHVHVQITKDQKACGRIFFAAHGGGILSLACLEDPIGEISRHS